MYVRVSTAEQARDGYSLTEQEQRCIAYIEAQGWTYVGTFKDPGVKGNLRHRPGLDALRGHLDEIDAAVQISIDRFGRSTKNLLDLYDEFEQHGVALVFLREQLDTSTPVGRLLRTVLSAIAEFERELIAERVTANVAARAAQGKPHGRLHYGYRLNPEEHGPSWVPEPSEAAVYERLFAEILAGNSQQQIARHLNAEGSTTRSGGDWTQGTVRKLLHSRTPLGERNFRGEWMTADYEPIVEEVTWNAAQAIIAANARPNGRKGGRGRSTRSGHIFTGGMLKCGCCGRSMVPRSDPYPAYYCMTRKARGVDACPMLPVPKRIDDAVLDYFTNEALDVDATRCQIEEAFERRIAEARARREQAEREAMSAEERMRRVKRAFQDGNLDADDWREQRRELTAERDAAERAVTNAIEHEQRVRTEDALTDAEEAALRRLAAIRDAVTGVQSDPTRTDGFRATLQRLFSGFTLHWLDEEVQRVAVAEPPRYWQPECLLPGGLYIEPHVRPESIAIAGVWPMLKRVALDGDTEAEAFAT